MNNETDPNQKVTNNSDSSAETTGNPNSGESAVQKGDNIVNSQVQNEAINNTEQEEYVSDINIETKQGEDETPKTQQMFDLSGDDDNDDEDDDDPLTELEIGDDPDETKKKIPVM